MTTELPNPFIDLTKPQVSLDLEVPKSETETFEQISARLMRELAVIVEGVDVDRAMAAINSASGEA